MFAVLFENQESEVFMVPQGTEYHFHSIHIPAYKSRMPTDCLLLKVCGRDDVPIYPYLLDIYQDTQFLVCEFRLELKSLQQFKLTNPISGVNVAYLAGVRKRIV